MDEAVTVGKNRHEVRDRFLEFEGGAIVGVLADAALVKDFDNWPVERKTAERSPAAGRTVERPVSGFSGKVLTRVVTKPRAAFPRLDICRAYGPLGLGADSHDLLAGIRSTSLWHSARVGGDNCHHRRSWQRAKPSSSTIRIAHRRPCPWTQSGASRLHCGSGGPHSCCIEICGREMPSESKSRFCRSHFGRYRHSYRAVGEFFELALWQAVCAFHGARAPIGGHLG